MSTLWLYGDSFTEATTDPSFKTWPSILAEKLKVNNVVNKAVPGFANTVIGYQLAKDRPNIRQDDIVFVQLTDSRRVWLFEDRPEMSNWQNMLTIDSHLSNEQTKAINYYIKYLFNETENDFVKELVKYFALNSLRHANIRVMDAFSPMGGQNGCLWQTSVDEYVGKDLDEKLATMDSSWKKLGQDPRYNHLSEQNHITLANKIYTWYTQENFLLDLTTDFEKNLLTN